jgi:hypothetical protein
MIRLRHGSIAVFKGSQPEISSIKLLGSAYYNDNEVHKFSQIITLTSQNLVQLCNFMKRCRKEKAAKLPKSYLILLNFNPHRDTWRFLDVVKDFNISVIVFGNYCIKGMIKELLPYTSYIFDWHLQQTSMKRPIICVWSLHDRRQGIARIFDSVSTTNGFHVGNILKKWVEDVHPEAWTADSFESMQQHMFSARVYSTGSAGENSKKMFYATETMNLQKACTLLGIEEADVTNVDLIRKKWKQKAFRCHPDKVIHEEDKQKATDLFTQLGEAKKFLINE